MLSSFLFLTGPLLPLTSLSCYECVAFRVVPRLFLSFLRLYHCSLFFFRAPIRDHFLSCSGLQPASPCHDPVCEDATSASSPEESSRGRSAPSADKRDESSLTEESLRTDYFDPHSGRVQIWSRWPYHCVAVPGETPWCTHAATRKITNFSDADSVVGPKRSGRRLTKFTIVLYGLSHGEEGEVKREENGTKQEDLRPSDPGLVLNDLVYAIGILSVSSRRNGDARRAFPSCSSSLGSSNKSSDTALHEQGKAWCLCEHTQLDEDLGLRADGPLTVRLHVFMWKRLSYFNPAVDLLRPQPFPALEKAEQTKRRNMECNPAAVMFLDGLKQNEQEFAKRRSMLLQYLAEYVCLMVRLGLSETFQKCGRAEAFVPVKIIAEFDTSFPCICMYCRPNSVYGLVKIYSRTLVWSLRKGPASSSTRTHHL